MEIIQSGRTLFILFQNPDTVDESYFATRQEGRRKDIERSIGVLQTKFQIIALPHRLWRKSIMQTIMYSCFM